MTYLALNCTKFSGRFAFMLSFEEHKQLKLIVRFVMLTWTMLHRLKLVVIFIRRTKNVRASPKSEIGKELEAIIHDHPCQTVSNLKTLVQIDNPCLSWAELYLSVYQKTCVDLWKVTCLRFSIPTVVSTAEKLISTVSNREGLHMNSIPHMSSHYPVTSSLALADFE